MKNTTNTLFDLPDFIKVTSQIYASRFLIVAEKEAQYKVMYSGNVLFVFTVTVEDVKHKLISVDEKALKFLNSLSDDNEKMYLTGNILKGLYPRAYQLLEDGKVL